MITPCSRQRCIAVGLFIVAIFLWTGLISLPAQEEVDAPPLESDAGESEPDAAPAEEMVYEPEELTMDEKVRRQELELAARHDVEQAVEAYTKNEFEQAIELYKAARKKLEKAGKAPRIQQQLQDIDEAIGSVYTDWADHLAQRGAELAKTENFDEAIDKIRKAIELKPDEREKYNQLILRYRDMQDAAQFRSEIAMENVMPDRTERLREIRTLMEQGQMLYDEERYTQAREKFEEALARNPYHLPAIRYLRRIHEKVRAVGEERRLATEAERLSETVWTWSEPVSLMKGQEWTGVQRPVTKEKTGIYAKLDEIIFPQIDFEEATVHQVVRYLRDKSKELDPEGEGVNILLQLTPAGADRRAEPAEAAAPAEEAWDLEGWDLEEEGAAPAAPAEERAAPAARASAAGQRTISMNMTNIPLGEAIRYITMGAGLKYKVEPHAVIIADPSVALEEMETRFYPMQAGVLETAATAEAEPVAEGGWAMGGDGDGGGRASASSPEQLKEFFGNFGIDFPEGSKIAYDPRTSKLVVRNTPRNLREVERVLNEINKTPTQVTIEAKFVEIQQSDLEALGFQWLINEGATGKIADRYQFTIEDQIPGDPNDVLNTNLSNALRFASSNTEIFSGSDAVLGITSILGSMEFSTVIHALNRADSSDVLSAPKVTATSGQTAILRMVTERYFPEEWTEPEYETDDEGNITSFTPSSPEFGDARDIGVVLEATPVVDPDNYTINLLLRPQVNEFIGYDTELNTDVPIGNRTFEYKFQMPIISARTLETNVVVWDGETVVLGGMIREQITDYDDKVPLLGDAPLIGPLFRSKAEKKEKFNLLIFVTARLVNPTGQPIRPGQEVRGLPDFGR
ncbi:MAG: hypothetical protein K9N51_11135 [Candidatus Pacebacteria bacterium]|nr:hypothetical protein [Candidatus Paceibacterota bacterium]